jgi:hypothetical protein
VLENFKSQSQLVVAAAPASDEPALERQRAKAARDAAGLAYRRLRLLEIVGGTIKDASGPTSEDGHAIRQALGLGSRSFSVVLVGLDGGVKMRQDEAFANDALIAAIDAVPMSRQ